MLSCDSHMVVFSNIPPQMVGSDVRILFVGSVQQDESLLATLAVYAVYTTGLRQGIQASRHTSNMGDGV